MGEEGYAYLLPSKGGSTLPCQRQPGWRGRPPPASRAHCRVAPCTHPARRPRGAPTAWVPCTPPHSLSILPTAVAGGNYSRQHAVELVQGWAEEGGKGADGGGGGGTFKVGGEVRRTGGGRELCRGPALGAVPSFALACTIRHCGCLIVGWLPTAGQWMPPTRWPLLGRPFGGPPRPPPPRPASHAPPPLCTSPSTPCRRLWEQGTQRTLPPPGWACLP